MSERQFLSEADLAKLAKRFRKQAKRTRPQAARELGVSHTSVFNAEETPSQSLAKVRMRMIEKYSGFKVAGPVYLLRRK
jgi:DNA-binding XRE family transcriptional regulator